MQRTIKGGTATPIKLEQVCKVSQANSVETKPRRISPALIFILFKTGGLLSKPCSIYSFSNTPAPPSPHPYPHNYLYNTLSPTQSVRYPLARPPVWCLFAILFTFMSITVSAGAHCVCRLLYLDRLSSTPTAPSGRHQVIHMTDVQIFSGGVKPVGYFYGRFPVTCVSWNSAGMSNLSASMDLEITGVSDPSSLGLPKDLF